MYHNSDNINAGDTEVEVMSGLTFYLLFWYRSTLSQTLRSSTDDVNAGGVIFRQLMMVVMMVTMMMVASWQVVYPTLDGLCWHALFL